MGLMDAGIETSTSFIQNIVLAFLAYPECQKKAQEEMDRVVGGARMPTLEDYEELPYLRAFVEEVCFPISVAAVIGPDNRNAASTIQASLPSSVTAHGDRRCIGQSYWFIPDDKCIHELCAFSTMVMCSQKARCYSKILVSITLVVDSADLIN